MSNSEFVPDPTQPKWKQKIAERLWKDSQTKAYAKPEQAVATEDYSQFMDSVPDVSANAEEDSKRLEVVDRQKFIDGISIIDVYKKLTGKSVRIARGQTESIMGFCVNPHHNNTNDEAMWMNSIKNTWRCEGQCQTGGTQVGMVAASMGIDDVGSGRLRGQYYAKAEEQLLQMFGWEKVKSSNGKTNLLPPEPKEAPKPKKESPKQEQETQPLASVTSITDEDLEEDSPNGPVQHSISLFDWRSAIPDGTFLKEYMNAASQDDCVELFHFGYALILLGLATGKQVEMEDLYSIYPNLYVMMYGDTGGGKTKASLAMKHVLGRVLPYDKTQEPQIGALHVKSPSSGSGIVTPFRRTIEAQPPAGAPKGGKKEFVVKGDVKAVIEYGELEELSSRMERDQTGLRPTVQDLFHAPEKIGTIAKSDGEMGYYAHNPFGSIVSTVQPDNTNNILKDQDLKSGFINRFLFFAGEYKPSIPRGKPMLHLFESAIEKLEEIRDWAYMFDRTLRWNDDAGELWDSFQHNVLEPDIFKYGKNLFNRNVTNMKKMVILSVTNSMRDMIEVQDVQFAMAMWPWLRDCYNLFAGRLGVSDKTELEEKIIYNIELWAKKGRGEMPIGTLKERLNNNGNVCSRDDMMKALETLERSGELKRIEKGFDRDGKKILGPGRRTEKWCIA